VKDKRLEEYEEEDVRSSLDLRLAETVDSYQDREKKCMIYSITTHFPHKTLGLFDSPLTLFSLKSFSQISFSSLAFDTLESIFQVL